MVNEEFLEDLSGLPEVRQYYSEYDSGGKSTE
jgi:hypothetical protein